MTAQPAAAQFGSLRGIAKMVKDGLNNQQQPSAEQKQPAAEVKQPVTERPAAVQAQPQSQPQPAAAPWPMCGGLYKDKSPREFLYNIADESDGELSAMRDKLLSRYKSNLSTISNWGPNADIAQQENQNFLRFLYEIQTIVSANTSNVSVSYNGAINSSDAHYLITNRKMSGIGCFVMEKGGRFQFVMKDDSGTFLNAEELSVAKDAATRMRKLQQLTYGLNDALKADQSNYDVNLGMLYNICGMYANAVEKACEENKPENIERKPRPAAGSLHASMKAQALAVAKAEDPDVVDVIITSSQWDVKMRGAIPVNRNIYGYYIYKDEFGLQCYSRMWTEDYQGNGKYGPLRKGGVGVGSPFYLK